MKDYFHYISLGIFCGIFLVVGIISSLLLGFIVTSVFTPAVVPLQQISRPESAYVLISGVTGFLGSHIAHKLSLHGYSVVGLDNVFDGSEDTRFKLLRTDNLLNNTTIIDYSNLCNSSLLETLNRKYTFQFVFLLSTDDRCACLAPLLSTSLEHRHRSIVYIFYQINRENEFQACFGHHHKLRGVALHVLEQDLVGPHQWPYVHSDTHTHSHTDRDSQHLGPDIIYNHLTGGELYIEDVSNGLLSFMHKLSHNSYLTSSPHALQFFPQSALYHTASAQALNRTLQWLSQHESQLMPCECSCQVQPIHSASMPVCFNSAWGEASRVSREASSGCSVVLYTVLISPHADRIHPLPSPWHPGKCSFAFITSTAPLYLASLNSSHGTVSNWILVPVSPLHPAWSDLRRASRLPKLTPDYFFHPDVQYAAYVDSKLLLSPDLTPDVLVSFITPPLGLAEIPLLVLIQHPFNAHLLDDLDLLVHHPQRPHISHYPQLVERQGKHYRAMERKAGSDGRKLLCLNFTFDAALLVHNIGSRYWSSSGDGQIVSKGPGARFRCAWLREYMNWGDRDQLAGGLVLGLHHQRTIAMVPSDVRSRYDQCPGERVVLDYDTTKQVMYSVRILPRSNSWRLSSHLATLQRMDWNE